MSTLDWPTAREFQPASMSWGATTPRTRWAAAYTGQVQSVSHLADRLRCSLVLPPCAPALAGPREAFFMGAASSGDWLRVPHWQRPVPVGTLRGAPLISAIAAAGARTVVLKNVRGSKNLLIAPAAFGDPHWTGSATATANTHTAPDGTVTADTLHDGSTEAFQQRQQSVAVAADSAGYVFSIYVRKTTGGTAPVLAFNIAFTGGTTVAVSARLNTDTGDVTNATAASIDANWWRLHATLANNGTNNVASVDVYPAAQAAGVGSDGVGATGSAVVWGAQIELGTTPTDLESPATLLGGDLIKVGNQLLPVAYAGATAAADGTMTVPLALPLRAAVAVNDAVAWSAPTATMQLVNVEPTFGYAPPGLQSALEIELSEVFA